MTVHKKLMEARIQLQNKELKKSGKNTFAGYSYFELGDFLPEIQSIFHSLGLCGIVSYEADVARLTITDIEDGTVVTITSPMAEANLKGAHAIQNLGAVETYQRRYLWMTAMEIVEHDAIDSSEPSKPVPVASLPKATPAPTGKVPTKIEGREGPWQLKVSSDSSENLQAWIGVVMDAARLALGAAATQKDVMDIFKVNRAIFDKLKQEAPEDHELLMGEFKTVKDKFGAKA